MFILMSQLKDVIHIQNNLDKDFKLVLENTADKTRKNIYDFIRKKINELGGKYNIKSIAFDRWNSSQLVINLTDDGAILSPFGQGYASMSAPTKELEKMVLKNEINHLGNPVLRWQMQNVSLRTDPAENIKIDKAKSSEKVDGIVALVMALGEWMTDDTEGESVYSDRGLIII